MLAASTFSAGLLLLPTPLQADVRQLYHMLRTIDDLVDENDPQAAERVEAIESWTNDVHMSTPETRTLNRLSSRYPIPPQAVADFCEGMRQDLEGTSIENETDLDAYCHRVAGTVGIMLAAILGTTHPDGEQKMETLGRAMQRTNIVRDIDEDLAGGRLYVPRTAIEQFGFPTPGHRAALLRDQIARADALYEDGMRAIPMLTDGRAWMAISTALYREYLRQIERDGFGRKRGRTTIPAWRRHALIAKHQVMRNPARQRRVRK